MKTCALLKHIGLAAVVLTVAIGCTTTPTAQVDDDAEMALKEAREAMQAKQAMLAAEASDAIANAIALRSQVIAEGCEWEDTNILIANAQDQLSQGNPENAIAMANRASDRAEAALADCQTSMGGSTPAATEIPDTMPGSYTVVSGDSLWGISAMDDIYADPYQWPLIYRANQDQITDADLIFPGQEFSITRGTYTLQVDAAIEHAKTRGAWSVGEVEDSDLDYLRQ